ncbi:hypothetical protein HMPREF1139_1679 [Campylobacter sp. FOBRC14]|nr:hypothetical protein HMPREF1139_1679 [Campylobacter sp. FOBRC14]
MAKFSIFLVKIDNQRRLKQNFILMRPIRQNLALRLNS